jgi:Cu-processing system permease protein
MNHRDTKVLALCARHELLLAVRSRFLVIFAAVFGALALLVASAGYILTGGMGMQDFARTASSLVELVLLVVPLASLVIGTTALTPDRGSAELLYSQPVGRRTILLGRLAGLFVALVGAQAVGFGAAGLVLFARAGQGGLGSFLGVVGSAAVLTAVFLALAAAITAGGAGRRRARHLATALSIWFAAVVLFDVAALGIASLLASGTASRLLMVSVILNPVDAVRTATLLAIEGTTAFGAASLAFLRFTGGSTGAAMWLALSAAVWIVGPVLVGAKRLERADL